METCDDCGFSQCVEDEKGRVYCLRCGAGFTNDRGAIEDAKKILEKTVQTLQDIDQIIGVGRATALVWTFLNRDRRDITEREKDLLRGWLRLPTEAPKSTYNLLVYGWSALVPGIRDSPAFQVLIAEAQK